MLGNVEALARFARQAEERLHHRWSVMLTGLPTRRTTVALLLLALGACASRGTTERAGIDVMRAAPDCSRPTPVLSTPLAREPTGVTASDRMGTLVGTVSDRAGHALVGAQLFVDLPKTVLPVPSAMAATTDSAGGFAMRGIAPGAHELYVRILSYYAQRRQITLPPGRVDTLRFVLKYDSCVGY